MGSIEKQRITEWQKLLKEAEIDYYIVPTADYHNSEYVSDYFKMREFLSGFTAYGLDQAQSFASGRR